MNYQLSQSLDVQNMECLVLGIPDKSKIKQALHAAQLDNQPDVNRAIAKLQKPGDWIWSINSNGLAVAVVLCGLKEQFTPASLKKRIQDIADLLIKHKIHSALISLPQVHERTVGWQTQQMVLQFENVLYQFNDYKTQNSSTHRPEVISFHLPHADEHDLHAAQSIAKGVNLTRRLADMPANDCTPSYLAQQAVELDQQYPSVSTTVVDAVELRQLGLNALMAVAKGSHEAPKLVEMHYQGTHKDTQPIVLVGKGITFDSGGLSLKPADAMVEMKYDMTGAASVIGTLKACAELKLPVNVIGLIACAENLPSGTATKPGDIIKSYSGQTIEITNTDAEGRLVLADALTYAERYKPKLVLDIATLTGAMVVALGGVRSGFMTRDEQIASLLDEASKASDDLIWRMPLDEAYQEALDSPIADMINANLDRTAGAVTAACFLSRYTENYPWAHLDIAGTAWVSGKKRQATGRPVPLLVEFIRHASNPR